MGSRSALTTGTWPEGDRFSSNMEELVSRSAHMTLHPLAAQFASVADEYDRGRPDYPPAVIGALAAELGLAPGVAGAPGARVLDLGAGTGKLSRALLGAGFDVIAVEPLDSMRELVAAHLGADRVKAGSAEAIPLPDASVDAVTMGDSFHWFEQPAALTEIRRVLRPGGGVAILNTLPDWTGAAWAHEVGQLVAGARPEHPHFDGPPWQEAVRLAGGFGAPREIRVTATQPTSPERILAHVASMSWVAAMPVEERTAHLDRARTLMADGETPSELPVQYVIGLAQLAAPG